jgi:hypothetical protein
MTMGGGAAVGGHSYEGDKDSFAGEIGGVVLLEDLEVFAGFADGCVNMLRSSENCW